MAAYNITSLLSERNAAVVMSVDMSSVVACCGRVR